jgi:hypothetical protein
MADEKESKVNVTLQVDPKLVERIQSAVRRLPPGWDLDRVFEIGALRLLERLEQEHGTGRGSA